MSYEVIIDQKVEKDLKKIAKQMVPRLLEAMYALADDPRPSGAVKIVGEEITWRIRIGDYRVLYEIEEDILIVTVVQAVHRKDAYKKK